MNRSALLVAALAAGAMLLGGAGSGVCVNGRALRDHVVLALAGRSASAATRAEAGCWVDLAGRPTVAVADTGTDGARCDHGC